MFLNFGRRYPNHPFNAVIFNLQAFPEARTWEGKTIKVRGKIQLYGGNGKAEIILERPEQVMIDSTTTVPQDARPQGREVAQGEVGGISEGTDITPVMDYDSAPRPIKITRPQYPQEAFVKKIEGTVVVEILIDSQGRVERARVLQTIPLLDAAALQCVRQWTFEPAIKHGHPVPTLAHAPVAFQIYARPGQQIDSRPAQRKQRPVTPPS